MNTSATIRDPNNPSKRMAVPLVDGKYLGGTPAGWSAWELETTAPIQPAIKRNEQGGIDTLVNPLEQWKNQTAFMQIAKDIIKQKQGMNQDIQASKAYWRTLIRDTSPFGGTRTPEAQLEGAFTDKKFRQLSPEDQASIQASRYAAGQAHLQGLGEEEKYREIQTKDTLQVLKDLWAEKENLSKEARDTEQAKLQAQKTKLEIQKLSKEIGYKVDDEGNVVQDLSNADVNSIISVIKEIESNGDYNAKGSSGEYGAYQFMPDTWNSWLQEYIQSSKINISDLGVIMSNAKFGAITPELQDAVATWKIQQLLNKGNTPEQIASIWNSGSPDWKGKVGINKQGISYNTPAYVERFKNVLATYIQQPGEQLELSSSVKTGLMQAAGLTNANVKGYTADDWILLKSTVRDAVFEEAIIKVKGGEGTTGWDKKIVNRGQEILDPDPELIKAKLIETYGNVLDTTDIDSIMVQSGYEKNRYGKYVRIT